MKWLSRTDRTRPMFWSSAVTTPSITAAPCRLPRRGSLRSATTSSVTAMPCHLFTRRETAPPLSAARTFPPAIGGNRPRGEGNAAAPAASRIEVVGAGLPDRPSYGFSATNGKPVGAIQESPVSRSPRNRRLTVWAWTFACGEVRRDFAAQPQNSRHHDALIQPSPPHHR